MRKCFIFIICLLAALPANAQLKEYSKLYNVDLDEEIPQVWRLKKEFEKETSRYNWNYDFNWRIPSVFNSDFKKQITDFGHIEKRIDNPDEESLLRDLKRIPKSFYPYIGPMLHRMRGLSGKVLDLPGIKETKNKFPERIAERMQNIPNIEWTSPELYLYLSPQFWGEGLDSLEYPDLKKLEPEDMPDVRIKPEFIQKLKAKVKASDFGQGKTPPTDISFRHFNPDINTPLSSADVRAFLDTFDALDKFRKNNNNELKLIMIDSLIGYWDEKNGVPEEITFLKQVVNPCQTIVRKVRWSNLQDEFQQAIGVQGFNLKDWAYTCDKTIKAFRVHNMPQAYTTTLRLQRKGYYYQFMDPYLYSDEEKRQLRYFLEAFVWTYTTNMQNIDAIKPYNLELKKKLLDLNMHFAGTPIIMP